MTDSVAIDISRLAGHITPTSARMVDFDDRTSFAVDVDSAVAQISTTSLTNDLNDFVFAAHDAPLKKLSATIHGSELTLKGILPDKGDISFESTGTLAVTAEGMMRVHIVKVKAFHLPVKGLMDMLGLDTAKLLDTRKVEGVSVDKDDLIVDPQVILPSPRFRGRLGKIQIENEHIALTFVSRDAKSIHPLLKNECGGRNYLQFKGGTVRFWKLTMVGVDLVLVDTDPQDSFNFAIDHYKEQLVAAN